MNWLKRLFHKHNWKNHLTSGNARIGLCHTMECGCGEYLMVREASIGRFENKLTKQEYLEARKKQREWLKEVKNEK